MNKICKPKIFVYNFYKTPGWWNWQTRTFEGRMLNSVGVRVPLPAPINKKNENGKNTFMGRYSVNSFHHHAVANSIQTSAIYIQSSGRHLFYHCFYNTFQKNKKIRIPEEKQA